MSLNDFEILKLLGKGAFASVYQVKRKKDNIIYAMKRVKFGTMSSKEKDNALNEVRILASVQHQNIIGYKESFYDDESKTLNIIMDFANDGDLESKIKKHIDSRTNLPENTIWNYLIQILQGLKALHSAKIMHRDLKCANIFLKENVIKLGDLNVSKLIKNSNMHTQTGTPYYASPEVWSNKPYDYKSDIWSVGCIIYELCALKPPFRGISLEDLYQNVLKGKYEPIPSIYSKELSQVIGIMLQVRTDLRPDVNKLIVNPLIIKKIDYSTLDAKDAENLNMLNTIKLPKNIKEINQKLPKNKNYDIGDVILERKNSEENMRQKEKINEKIAPSYKINPTALPNNQHIAQPQQKPVIISNNNNNYLINNQVNKPVIGNNIPSSYQKDPIVNPYTKDNKLQDQRAELMKKYNVNPQVNSNDRARPRTPDALPKKNVYEVKRNEIQQNINKPSNQNPYLIKR